MARWNAPNLPTTPTTLKRIIPKTEIQSHRRIKALKLQQHCITSTAFPLIIHRPKGFPVRA
jgi:hypothetical protein